ncbi:MAG: class 1 fructose-bisphosphatase [Chloroflexi bacterium]|nr:MAG: class 1 fructose-bisphosphatase [Chloroflexota bacterium]
MIKHIHTLADYLLQEEQTATDASGSFFLLLTRIEVAAKRIADKVRAVGLVDLLGKTGTINTFGEEVQKLDEFANQLLVDTLLTSGAVYAVVSEEMEHPVFALPSHAGEYLVYIDPIDGSSNIDTNCPIGTIFSVYHKDGGFLQQGNRQVASGYVMYGSSVMLVYTSGHGVQGFTLEPASGSFVYSHRNITLPAKGNIYSINEAYETLYDERTRAYLAHLRSLANHTARYVGSLVADAHRTLLKGGIFLYPPNRKQPEGKLRLMLEVNPYALLIEQAGGKAMSGNGKSPLTITPKTVHDRTSLVMGSKENVNLFADFLSA